MPLVIDRNSIHLKYRPDIDGLRGLAVLSVLGFHFFPDWISGGFIGVDIFFVISGYLISTIIFKNLAQQNFSFIDFYSRRIRRIFPALLLVFIACLVTAWFALLADEYQYLGKHIAGGSVFASNFLLWSESGYFDKSAGEKILLHLWSLGIEEQFYLIWPIAVFCLWRLKINLMLVMALLVSTSFYLNMKVVEVDIAAAFFSPQTRIWELVAGAILAYLGLNATISQKSNQFFVNACAWIGLSLLCLGLALIRKESFFPGAWALLPVMGAVCLINSSTSWVNQRVLANPILVFFGLISFPLYLWHWPLLAFSTIFESGLPAIDIRLILLLISIGLAWATYYFVERPIRLGTNPRRQAAYLILAMALVGMLGLTVFLSKGFQSRSAVTMLPQQEESFLWPEAWNVQESCIKKYPFYGRYCLESNPAKPPTIALIGDSHANHLFNGLAKYYSGSSENILNLGGWLPIWNVENGSIGEQAQRVLRRQTMEKILDEVSASPSIHTLVLAFRENAVNNTTRSYAPYTNYWKLINHPTITNEGEMLTIGMRETLKRLEKTGKRIIWVEDIPGLDFNPKECLDARPIRLTKHRTSPCGIEKVKFEGYAKPYHAIVGQLSAEFPQVKVFHPSSYLCDDFFCFAVKDGQMLYRDDNHLSDQGSSHIGQKLGVLIEDGIK